MCEVRKVLVSVSEPHIRLLSECNGIEQPEGLQKSRTQSFSSLNYPNSFIKLLLPVKFSLSIVII